MSSGSFRSLEDYRQRRQAQGKQTERAILQAVMDLSRSRSFDKLSVRDICRQAGITTGAFYHHFKTKEEILSRGFASLDVYMEQQLAGREGDPPLDRLHQILTIYARFMEEQGWELVSRYYQQRLVMGSQSSIDATRYTLRAMTDCLRQAVAEGAVLPPGLDTEQCADFFFRHFRGVVVDWALHRGSYPLLPRLQADHSLFLQMFPPYARGLGKAVDTHGGT